MERQLRERDVQAVLVADPDTSLLQQAFEFAVTPGQRTVECGPDLQVQGGGIGGSEFDIDIPVLGSLNPACFQSMLDPGPDQGRIMVQNVRLIAVIQPENRGNNKGAVAAEVFHIQLQKGSGFVLNQGPPQGFQDHLLHILLLHRHQPLVRQQQGIAGLAWKPAFIREFRT